jgi:hypothetical protein
VQTTIAAFVALDASFQRHQTASAPDLSFSSGGHRSIDPSYMQDARRCIANARNERKAIDADYDSSMDSP